MVLKKDREYIDGPIPLDESWWTAVLEDVEAHFTPEHHQSNYHTKVPHNHNEEGASSPEEIDWDWAKKLYEQDQVISLEVTNHNRGGLLVNGEGIQGFVPASHLVGVSKKPSKKDRDALLSPYLGRSLRLKVIECDPERSRIVFSERAAQTNPGSRLELLDTLQVGDRIWGRVTTITNFGVFVDLGGVEGLIHISELSWGRVRHPSDVLSLGEEIEVYIVQLDRERIRVALSLKRLQPNPWDSVRTRYHTGQVTNAVITNIVSYGAFARLEDGLDGLIHISEFGDAGTKQSIEDILAEGQQIKVCILNIDSTRQRLGLRLHIDDGDDVP